MTATALIEALRAAAAAGDREAAIFLPPFADWFVRSANAGHGDGERPIPTTREGGQSRSAGAVGM